MVWGWLDVFAKNANVETMRPSLFVVITAEHPTNLDPVMEECCSPMHFVTALPVNSPQAIPGIRLRGGLSRKLVVIALVAVGSLTGAAVTGWWFFVPPAATPAERLAKALKLLDANRLSEAREVAKEIEARKERDPNFPGGAEYIQGMVAFQAAEDASEATRMTGYSVAASYLREAQQRSLSADYEPKWTYALGRTLFLLGDAAAAQPLLEDVVRNAFPNREMAAAMLVDLYIDPSFRTPQLLEDARGLSDLALAGALPAQTEQLLLQRSELLLALGQAAEATETLAPLANRPGYSANVALLKARTLLEAGDTAEIVRLLEPIANEPKTQDVVAAQTWYLLGLAESRLAVAAADRERSLATRPVGEPTPVAEVTAASSIDHRHQAIRHFRVVIDRFSQTQEAVVANLEIADLLRREGNTERALRAYGDALRAVPAAEQFRNRWLSANDFRTRVQKSWGELVSERRFAEAIALSEMLTPLFSRDQAYDLAARASRQWADVLEGDLASLPYGKRQAGRPLVQTRWMQTGAAFGRLANARRASSDHADALIQSAEAYERAGRFDLAFDQLEHYLSSGAIGINARTRLKRAQLLMNLDRIDDAAEELSSLIESRPTDPVVFSAEVLLGRCHYERNRLPEAEATWRGVLNSAALTPAAAEWREALGLLARILGDRGADEYRKTEGEAALANAGASHAFEKASATTAEAISLLEQYLVRYPDQPAVPEVRYRLGKSLQIYGKLERRNAAAAETVESRGRWQQKVQNWLTKALEQFQMLKESLLLVDESGRLDPAGEELLKQACFEIPHTQFELGQNTEAILGYSLAANRYPKAVESLSAFVQMATCYSRLGQQSEAQSMLDQARVMLNHKQIPDAAFSAPSTNLTRAEWNDWLERASRVQN